MFELLPSDFIQHGNGISLNCRFFILFFYTMHISVLCHLLLWKDILNTFMHDSPVDPPSPPPPPPPPAHPPSLYPDVLCNAFLPVLLHHVKEKGGWGGGGGKPTQTTGKDEVAICNHQTDSPLISSFDDNRHTQDHVINYMFLSFFSSFFKTHLILGMHSYST